jgi:hypothetical protein
MRRFSIVAVLLLTACTDGTRPRPGASTTEPEPENPVTLLWYETQPRVVTHGRADSIELNVGVSGDVDAVQYQPRSGPLIQLRRLTDSLYTVKVHPNTLLFGYQSGNLHQLTGLLQVVGEGLTDEIFLTVNVKDATVPAVNVNSLPGSAQSSQHVFNLRVDALATDTVSPLVVRTLLDNFGDNYTFVTVIDQVQAPLAPSYIAVRNDVTGLGIARFDRGATYNSAAKLEGILHFPNASDFDLAQTTNLRVLSHRWMNFSTQPSLALGRPLWPLSSLAGGVLGWSQPQNRQPLLFPFEIVRQADGTHTLRGADQIGAYNDMELYLIGMLPGDSVRTHFVFVDQNQVVQVRAGGVLRGAVDSVRVADIVARDGIRTPSSAASPRDFRAATIVLSRNRLLTQDEMAFFDYMAARGEQRVALQYFDGTSRGTTLPFFVATGGRATLATLLSVAPLILDQ